MQSIPNAWIKKAARLSADHDHATRDCRNEANALGVAKFAAADAREAREVLQTIAQSVQQTAHKKIASVVTRCLEAVFPDHYEFRIHFERKRGKTEARLVFIRGESEMNPLDAAGGGVCDVAAFALRVACLMLSQPPLRRVLVLDEPFAHCKPPEKIGPLICSLITTLSHDLGIQFIIIPSIESHYQLGKIISID